MIIEEQYIKETNKKAMKIWGCPHGDCGKIECYTDEYVEWLKSCILTEREKARHLSEALLSDKFI
jgi:hypothetical protein